MKINLHIERLVLDGLPIEARQSGLVRSAIETELTRLLTDHGLSSELLAGGALPHLRGGSIPLANEISPTRLGHQIAAAVHSGIGGEVTNESSTK